MREDLDDMSIELRVYADANARAVAAAALLGELEPVYRFPDRTSGVLAEDPRGSPVGRLERHLGLRSGVLPGASLTCGMYQEFLLTR